MHSGFWWWGEYRGIFCGDLPEAAPVYSGANASGSRLDSLLAEAKSVIVSGDASVIAHIGRENKSVQSTTYGERSM